MARTTNSSGKPKLHKTCKNTLWMLIATLFFQCVQTAKADSIPSPLAAAIILKIVSFEKNMAQRNPLRIFVVNNKSLEASIEDYGRNNFKKKYFRIDGGRHPPLNTIKTKPRPHIIIIGENYNPNKEDKIKLSDYVTTHNILLIGLSESLSSIAALAIHDDQGIPGVKLNIKLSRNANLKWNYTILDYVTLVEQ